MTRRERRWRQLRLLDLSLGALVLALALAPALVGWPQPGRPLAVDLLPGLPLYLWLAWRQYTVLDELGRRQLLVAYSVHGFVMAAGLVLLIAWSLWWGARPGVLALSTVFLAGWFASWLVWLGLRRPARQAGA